MNRTCIVVADAKHARFFSVDVSDVPRRPLNLAEGTVLFNPDVEAVRGDGAGRIKTERILSLIHI